MMLHVCINEAVGIKKVLTHPPNTGGKDLTEGWKRYHWFLAFSLKQNRVYVCVNAYNQSGKDIWKSILILISFILK